ncbi:acyl carrier protein [Halopseudomonas pelagia]|uniref:Acyl carrier protein n=1 Tax=Halopseudomonas pelagia TaxID=553151 RepID=A0AA91U0F8_9GAMM|nr:acyl carrier protein [Halopseudomonas pelagia]PCC98335.1 acyl carrier protein [Halopseudomonas pelagia]QFY56652.1 acyl carrier protein [Halopseudomonas pelagia]
MNEQEVLSALEPIFRDMFDDDGIDLTADTTAEDIDGWDSLAHVSLIVAAEQRFGVKFLTAELDSLHDVGHFAQLISKKLNG